MNDDEAQARFPKPRVRWRERMGRVLREVDAHPDKAHCLESLAGLAHSSPFHFHRQFSAMCGLTLARYMQLSRLRRAVLQLLAATLQDFIAWRRARRLSPDRAATYNILYDDPEAVPPQDYRLGLAVAHAGPVDPNDEGLSSAVIPAGRHAVLHHAGPDASLDRAIRWLYGPWLAASGFELADRPAWLQRLSLFPDVPAHRSEVLIHLPLAG